MSDNHQRNTRIAAVQMVSGGRVDSNMAEAARLIASAAEGGAGLVALPENAMLMGRHERDKFAHREDDSGGPLQDFFAEQAARHGVWLIAGTIAMNAGNPELARQSSLLFDSSGRRVARYDKLHLFDVQVSGDSAYRESATLEPGNRIVVADTPFGRLGMSICYDLRFPELYRAMVQQGAELLVVPSAFTARTGEAHWQTLIRARAIENLCYVLAPNQGGFHVNGRETHGESMIVDPWGQVMDSLSRGPGVVFGDLDHNLQHTIRGNFPALTHVRLPMDHSPTDNPPTDQ